MASPPTGGAPRLTEDRFGHLLDLYLGGVAAFLLFVLMVLTFIDVSGRTLINAPLPGGYEITELVMGVLIFAGLPTVSWRYEHITIDLLDPFIPPFVVRFQQAAVNLVGAVAVGVITWQTWALAAQLLDDGELTEFLQVPVAPVMYAISVLSGASTLVLAANVLRHLRRAEASEVSKAADPSELGHGGV